MVGNGICLLGKAIILKFGSLSFLKKNKNFLGSIYDNKLISVLFLTPCKVILIDNWKLLIMDIVKGEKDNQEIFLNYY